MLLVSEKMSLATEILREVVFGIVTALPGHLDGHLAASSNLPWILI